MDLSDAVPRHKADNAAAKLAVQLGWPTIEPVIDDILVWIQDANWPVAGRLIHLLRPIGLPLAPHLARIFETDDYVWQYVVIVNVLSAAPVELVEALSPQLERLATKPTAAEQTEELDEEARAVLVRLEGTG